MEAELTEEKGRDVNVATWLEEEAGVGLNDGRGFGPSGGRGFVRMNVACSRALLKQGLERIEAAVSSRVQRARSN